MLSEGLGVLFAIWLIVNAFACLFGIGQANWAPDCERKWPSQVSPYHKLMPGKHLGCFLGKHPEIVKSVK